MRVRLQNIASHIVAHKKILFAGVVLVLLFSFIPLSVAHAAGFWDGILNVIIGALAKVFEILASVTELIFKWVAGVMIFVIKYFMGLGVAPGAPNTPSFVETSFNYVRQFVNIFFILILVFIGLATILRLPSYQYQKTLRLLIIMALLINFSGVFVGFIVDMSNLVANSFLTQEVVESEWDAGSFHDPTAGASPESRMANYIARILFYFIAILIYFVLMLVFAVRTMFLWVLTILAPLAFASYILPATKGKIWDEWWKRLIEWSIFAIPISLFLYLAQGALKLGTIGKTTDAPWLGELLAPFTALFILYLGVTISMQMAPATAKAVADWGKGRGLAAGGWAAREGWRKIGKKTEEKTGGARKKGQDIAANAEGRLQNEKLNLFQKAGLQVQRFAGKTLSAAGGGLEIASQKGNLAVSKRDKDTIAQAEKDVGENSDKGFDIIDTEHTTAAAKGGLLEDTSKELGAFTKIIKNGDTDKIEARLKDGRMTWDFVRKMYKNSVDNGNVDQRRLIEKAFLSRALDKKDTQGNIITPNKLGVSAEDQEKIFEKIDGADFKGVIGEESLAITPGKENVAIDEIIKHRGADLMPQFLRNTNKEGRQKTSQYLNDKGVQWFVDNDAEDVLRYSISSGAASLGINPIAGITQNQLTAISSLGNKPSQDLQAEITNLTTKKGELEQRLQLPNVTGLTNVAGGPLAPGITQEEKENAKIQLQRVEKDLEARTREQTRRQRAQTAQATLTEEQPLSVQIARLKTQEEQLKQTAGTPREMNVLRHTREFPGTFYTEKVPIPLTRKGGVSYLAGERARAERKKIHKELEQLEAQIWGQPLELYRIERDIQETDLELRKTESNIAEIEQTIEKLRRKGVIEQTSEVLQRLRAQEQNRKTKVNDLRAKEENLTSQWRGIKAAHEVEHPEEILAGAIVRLRQEEKKADQELKQFQTAKEEVKKIDAVRERVGDLRERGKNVERDLIRTLIQQERTQGMSPAELQTWLENFQKEEDLFYAPDEELTNAERRAKEDVLREIADFQKSKSGKNKIRELLKTQEEKIRQKK